METVLLTAGGVALAQLIRPILLMLIAKSWNSRQARLRGRTQSKFEEFIGGVIACY